MIAIGQVGKALHEKKLSETVKDLEMKGYRVVRLSAKSPDAVATKDGKLFAIEVLGKYGSERNYKRVGGWTFTAKKKVYAMFDDVMIFTFPYEEMKGSGGISSC